MNTEAHLAVGWLLANLAGPEDRRFRTLVALSAVAPDLDALSFCFEPLKRGIYGECHHALGHNLFFALAFSALALLLWRARPWKILLLTQVGFYTHYFGDYFLTRFPLVFLWPVSDTEFIHSYLGPRLDDPVNTALSYASFLLLILLAILCRRTPLEMISAELDRRVVNLFARKPLSCHICHRKANERCRDCGRPVCMRDARLTPRMQVRCRACHEQAAVFPPPSPGAGVT